MHLVPCYFYVFGYFLVTKSNLISFSALRAAAAAIKHEDDRRLFRNASLRKRRKEMGDQMDTMRRVNRVT